MPGSPTDLAAGSPLNRRHFLGFAGGLAVAGAAASAGLRPFAASPASALSGAPAAGRPGYPMFSWDRVPVAADMGSRDNVFSQSEAAFIANNFAFISIEKGAALRAQPADARYAETGLYEDARRIKAVNPRCKVLTYFGMGGPNSLEIYHDATGYNHAWDGGAKGDKGKVFYNYEIPEMREWWTNLVTHYVSQPNIDGCFLDGASTIRPNAGKYEMIKLLKEKFDRLPQPKLLLINGSPTPVGEQYSLMDYADGAMIEHFDAFGKDRPDARLESLQRMIAAGRAGKIVMLKTWPGFTPKDEFKKTASYEEKIAVSRKNLQFPLACFLAAAQPYSYLQYGWGYGDEGGMLILKPDMQTVDPNWYPELLRPLGPPLNEPQFNGYVVTRNYQHARVHADLGTRYGTVEWS
jgi:hypothetical protein